MQRAEKLAAAPDRKLGDGLPGANYLFFCVADPPARILAQPGGMGRAAAASVCAQLLQLTLTENQTIVAAVIALCDRFCCGRFNDAGGMLLFWVLQVCIFFIFFSPLVLQPDLAKKSQVEEAKRGEVSVLGGNMDPQRLVNRPTWARQVITLVCPDRANFVPFHHPFGRIRNRVGRDMDRGNSYRCGGLRESPL